MLYLHIGAGKAGSTTIQEFLNSRLEELGPEYSLVETFGAESCWRLAAASGTKLAERYWVDQLGTFTEQEYKRFKHEFWQKATEEVVDKPCAKYIASSEHIFSMYGDQIEEIKKLRDNLNALFEEVKIVFYCREQVSWAKSFYAQLVKGPSAVEFSFDHFVDNLECHRNLWDYHKVISLWASVFGDENIIVRVFDYNYFVNGDLIADFSWTVNGGLPDCSSFEKPRNKNVSPKEFRLECLRRVNKLKKNSIFGNKVFFLIRRIVVSNLLDFLDKGKSFSSHRDKDILNIVSESNSKFNQRFLGEQEGKLPVLSLDSTNKCSTTRIQCS